MPKSALVTCRNNQRTVSSVNLSLLHAPLLFRTKQKGKTTLRRSRSRSNCKIAPRSYLSGRSSQPLAHIRRHLSSAKTAGGRRASSFCTSSSNPYPLAHSSQICQSSWLLPAPLLSPVPRPSLAALPGSSSDLEPPKPAIAKRPGIASDLAMFPTCTTLLCPLALKWKPIALPSQVCSPYSTKCPDEFLLHSPLRPQSSLSRIQPCVDWPSSLALHMQSRRYAMCVVVVCACVIWCWSWGWFG